MTQMNLSMKQKQTHRHREQTHGCQGGGMDWEFVISRCTLLYIEWINNTVLLCVCVCVCVCVYNNHFAVQQ